MSRKGDKAMCNDSQWPEDKTDWPQTASVVQGGVVRDACARVCDELVSPSRSHSDPGRAWITGTLDCAAAIRARGDL